MNEHMGKDIPPKEIKLSPDCELRFEVENSNETVYLELKSGIAEIFGTELVKGKTYTFTTGAKIAVFTWQGCELIVRTKKDTSYIAKETPMMFYLNCHCCLEQLRQKAEDNDTKGPITVIVGPSDVGKSTLSKILLNYAVRMGDSSRRPIFVDLDVGQGHISIPGTIGAMIVERPASVYDGFPQIAPLVYHYGYPGVQQNPKLYDDIVTQMADLVHQRMESSKKVKSSGVIINTIGWVKARGYQHLTHVVQAFKVDIILVLDQERLFNELVRDMPSFVKVALLPKSGGVVERSQTTRAEARNCRVREYFYGTPSNQLHPHMFDVKFSDVKIYQISSPTQADFAPIGTKTDNYVVKLLPEQKMTKILHHILSVSHASSDEEKVNATNIAGFVCVTKVDVDRQLLTLLSPQPKPLPNTILIISDIQFVDNR
ncbi:hypothetical protein V9T40_014646 [Parthenolecanium corni]|uniref:Protein CLP1 homolog n=1 Tax=Parthenolecanium corni TaxID=536013 RepID=A0AAN9XYH0_9HEMI